MHQRLHLMAIFLVRRAVPPDEVHLVDADDELVDAQDAAMQMWRRDCSHATRTLASTSTSARSAVDAPVAMLRVYWMCPGQSAMTNFRWGVAAFRVRDIDRDALFPLRTQAVGDEREIDLAQPAPFRRRLYGGDLIVEELPCVEEQPADRVCSFRRRPIRSWRTAAGPWCRRKVGAAGRRRAGQRGHGSGDPSRLRSSMAVSEKRSSATWRPIRRSARRTPPG